MPTRVEISDCGAENAYFLKTCPMAIPLRTDRPGKSPYPPATASRGAKKTAKKRLKATKNLKGSGGGWGGPENPTSLYQVGI